MSQPRPPRTDPGPPVGLDVRQVPFADPRVQELVERVQEEYVVRYGGRDTTPLEPGVFDPPRGRFLLGLAGGVPVAMGGWRLRSDVRPWRPAGVAEVKRMYVAPEARRHGYARRVLAELETTAREAGAAALVLETGTAQPEAIELYLAAGYEPVERFGYYAASPTSRYYGRPL